MSEQSTPAPFVTQSQVEYREIPGRPGYRVGTDGSIWSRWGKGARTPKNEWKKLKPSRTKKGYLKLRVGNRHDFAHKIVLETFVGPRPDGCECRHLDNNPSNNALSNLCWGTRLENGADKVRHGIHPRGEKIWRSALTAEKVRAIRRRAAAGESRYDLAEEFGVKHSCISHVINRLTWKHIE